MLARKKYPSLKSQVSAFYHKHIKIIPGVKSYFVAATLLFLLGLAITLLSWYVDKQRLASQQHTQLANEAANIQTDVVNRLHLYEQVLRGTNGWLHATDTPTPERWRVFMEQFGLNENYPGITGTGYIQYLRPDERQAYLDFLHNNGYPEAKIMPEGERAEYGPITYIYPMSPIAQRVIGYDALVESSRRPAAQKARDTGKVGISDKLVLLGDRNSGNTNNAGFILYVATYKGEKHSTIEARRANLQGYIFASFRAQNFFDKAIDKSKLSSYKAIQVFDGTSTDEKAMLYQSTDLSKTPAKDFSQTFTASVFDRPWTFRFAQPNSGSTSDTQRANMILIGGVTMSLAIAGFLFLMMLNRARDIAYAKQNEAQQAKDDLLSLASHQLRTPATAVKQYLGMILEGYTGEVDPGQLPALQKAYASNERQLETINQILYVAKADAGRLSVNPTRFDLNLLLGDIVLDLEDTLEDKEQTIKIEHAKKRLFVYADEACIRMVIENLISNASKYSHEGSQIILKTGMKNNMVYVSIIDEGVGIAPQDHDKLFKKFSRIDNDLSLQVGGSGIGLYIDKVLIELHNGKITVDSELGKGSTFTILLPKYSANNLTDDNNNNKSV